MIIDVPLPEVWGRAAHYCALVAYPGIEDGDRRKRIEGVVREGETRILKRRIPALFIATRLLLPLDRGGMRPGDAYRAVLDASDDLGFGNEEGNVRRLCWRESLPALAMTAPLKPLLQHKSLAELLYDATWVSDAIQLARRYVPVVAWRFHPPYVLAPQGPKSPASLPSNPAQIVTRLSE
jgi:hypothetical protein